MGQTHEKSVAKKQARQGLGRPRGQRDPTCLLCTDDTEVHVYTSGLEFSPLTLPVVAIMLCWAPAGISPLKGWLTCVGRLRLGACAWGVVCCNGGCRVWGRAINGCPVDPKLGKESWDAGRGTVTWNASKRLQPSACPEPAERIPVTTHSPSSTSEYDSHRIHRSTNINTFHISSA